MNARTSTQRTVQVGEVSVSDRIVTAARKCFEQYGIGKTTIEDIASRAGVSRPTVYKYFSGKDDLVDRISHDESVKVNLEVRKRLIRKTKFDEMLTEALFLVVRVAYENLYLRRALQYTLYQTKAAAPNSTAHQLHREWWGHFLEQARQTGDLARDVQIDEVLSWLTLSEGMLLTRIQAGQLTDDELRRLIRRFVVDPLIPR